MNIFDFSIHNTIRKVCVSEAIVPDANGIYTCAGVHGGRPAYRLQRESAVFWICCDGYKWCLVRQQDHPGKHPLYFTQFCNEQAGLAQGKLPTGRWCGPKGKVFCKIAYEYDEKAQLFIDRGDVGFILFDMNLTHAEFAVSSLCVFAA